MTIPATVERSRVTCGGTRSRSGAGSSCSTPRAPCWRTPMARTSGGSFATPGRPEVLRALASQVTAEVRRSDEEQGDIAVAAAPVIDEGELVGAVRDLPGRPDGE